MASPSSFDVIVVGGGLAGSTLAGVLARSGLGVLVVEREARFRDRIRREVTWPWGADEATLLGLEPVLSRAGCVPLAGIEHYQDQRLTKTDRWEATPMLAFSHPRLQEELCTWAQSLGATTLRGAKATGFAHHGRPTVTVTRDGREQVFTAKLVVGADGKRSGVRRWVGGTTQEDPEHNRFGGVLVTGIATHMPVLADASTPRTGFFWFAQSPSATRLYFRMRANWPREIQIDRSFAAFLRAASAFMPEGTLDEVEQAGPIGFFPNQDGRASQIDGNDVVLIGDAAGSADPTGGLGTSLLFRDVRELSTVQLTDRDWRAASAAFACRRLQYYAAMRAFDRWTCLIAAEEGDEADRRREQRARAKELDPTLGGFAVIGIHGPDGLVPDDAARRHFFGEDLI
jgi:2-polyprenyl-6-methoxyphenol hydroxylase-like FAD-dependent oxidoreductase